MCAGQPCGIDCEWRHPRPISIVQLAVSMDTIFCVDCVYGTALEATLHTLRALVTNAAILKVVFGFHSDLTRLRVLFGGQ